MANVHLSPLNVKGQKTTIISAKIGRQNGRRWAEKDRKNGAPAATGHAKYFLTAALC
jgi:hypothetical protein